MKIKMILSYICLFVFAMLVFLVLLFPGQQIAQYISHSLTNPGLNVYTHVDHVKPAFPFYLKSEDTKISIGQNLKIEPDFIKIKLGPGLIFGEQKQLKFNSQIYDGALNGRISFKDTQPIVYTNLQMALSGLKFNKFKYNTRLAMVTLSGNVSGQYSYHDLKGSQKDGPKDPENGTLLIEDFSAVLKNSLFNRLKLPAIDFSAINVAFTKDRQNINLTELTATGSVINLKLNGIIRLDIPILQSRLSLKGTILPDSPYLANFANSTLLKAMVKNIKKDGVRFTIGGTLKQPVIKI